MLLMQFSELASFFEHLEETSSRLTLIEILSDLFKKVHKDDIENMIKLYEVILKEL